MGSSAFGATLNWKESCLRARTMLLGVILFIAASLLYLIVPPQFLPLIRFLQGVGAAALSAVSLALVGVYYKENRGRAYGIYNIIKGAGYVISPLVGGLIIAQSNFSSIFIASSGVGVARVKARIRIEYYARACIANPVLCPISPIHIPIIPLMKN